MLVGQSTSFSQFALQGFGTQEVTPASGSCPHRTLALNAVDSKGVLVRGLSPTDFRATLGSAPVKILSIAPDERPHRIVIMVDASRSMGTKWKETLAQVSALAETSIPNAQIALLVFGKGIYERIDFAQGQPAVAERLRQMRAGTPDSARLVHGFTALYDSLLEGLQLLQTPTSADILYVVTDGRDNSSKARASDVVHRLTASGVRLFASIILNPLGYRTRTPEELEWTNLPLSDIVSKSGGEIMQPFVEGSTQPNAEHIAATVNLFHSWMIHNYLIEIETPVRIDKPRGWDLRLSPENKDRWKDVRVTYPTELAPCKP